MERQAPKESSRCGQKDRRKSGQESLGLENVENPVMGRTQRHRAAPRSRRRRRRLQRGGKLFDVQKLLNKTGMEFHWPGYQYMGPGTHLKKRLARGDPGISRLDRIAKAHDPDCNKAKNLQDKWVTDRKMIAKIDQLPGRKTLKERIVKNIMKAKLRLGMKIKKRHVVLYIHMFNKSLFLQVLVHLLQCIGTNGLYRASRPFAKSSSYA